MHAHEIWNEWYVSLDPRGHKELRSYYLAELSLMLWLKSYYAEWFDMRKQGNKLYFYISSTQEMQEKPECNDS